MNKREKEKRKEGGRKGERIRCERKAKREKEKRKKVASKQQGQTKTKCFKQIMYLYIMHCRLQSVLINLFKLLMFLPMLH